MPVSNVFFINVSLALLSVDATGIWEARGNTISHFYNGESSKKQKQNNCLSSLQNIISCRQPHYKSVYCHSKNKNREF